MIGQMGAEMQNSRGGGEERRGFCSAKVEVGKAMEGDEDPLAKNGGGFSGWSKKLLGLAR